MKNILLIILAIILLAVIVLALMMYFGSTPITKEKAVSIIDKLIEAAIGKKNVTQAIVYVDSPQHNLSETFAHGQLNGKNIAADTPFHVASVGKAFTATIIGVLIDEGTLSLDDKITEYLSDDVLKNLFLYEGNDYKDDVTIQNLLNHTSGVADYFEDEAAGIDKMQTLVINEPDTLWAPADLIGYTRVYQQAVNKPNAQYHYSDTGYILLGLIIENASGQSFDEMLHNHIFSPLNMNDSYLMFYSQPANDVCSIADVHLGDVNVKDYQSLSIDWAGGGIISTVNDLAVFIRALNNYEIVTKQTLESLYKFDNQFMSGIHYGNGFMEYHFNEFFPTLGFLPNYTGHMGVLGTQMFYDKGSDTVYISSFGSTDYSAGSVQTMIKVLSTLERIKE